MAIPEARSWLLDRKIIANEVGIGLIDDTRAFLESLSPEQLTGYLIGGLATATSAPARAIAVVHSRAAALRSSHPRAAAASIMAISPLTW